MKSKSSSESNSDLKARVNWTVVRMFHTGKFTFTVDGKKLKKKKKSIKIIFLEKKFLQKLVDFFLKLVNTPKIDLDRSLRPR